MSIKTTIWAVLIVVAAAGVAAADGLRNVKVGETAPDFELTTLDGGTVGSAALRGRAVIMVFLSPEQRRSEAAAVAAAGVWRGMRDRDCDLVFVTAEVERAAALRRHRAKADLTQPLLLDAERSLYGDLGLIVLPTTIVIDPEWRLAHVISSYRNDYALMLEAYAEHAMGLIDDARLAERLEASPFEVDSTAQQVARHRSTAEVLRTRGLHSEAEAELRAALEIAPANVDARLDLASLLIRQGQIDDAMPIVDAVLETDPGQRRGRLLHGIVLFHAGRLDAAEAELSDVLLLNPDPVQTHYYLGRVYEAKGDAKRALEHYRQSLARALEGQPL